MGLALPSLWVGWQLDDHWHRMMWQGWPGYPDLYRSFWDQFTFGDGDPARTQRFLDYGFFPWWHELESRTQPWRVVSTFTHWVDFCLWPSSPFLMHVQSLLWFGAMVWAGAVLYRRIHGVTWVAGLAALLFALDDAHGWAVGWLANRNALISALFGILTLIAHDQWRKDRSVWGALLAPLWFVLALLSAEAALAVAAYLFAYALFIDDGAPASTGSLAARKLRAFSSLFPYAVIAVLWQFFYKLLGFGAWGLALYVDPGREPLRFLEAVVERAPYLLLGQWAFPPSDIYVWLSLDSSHWMWLAAVLVLAMLALLMVPRLRRDRVSGFWCFGMLASVIPICSTLPQDRLLFFVGLGASPLIAQYIQSVWRCEGPTQKWWRKLSIALAAALLVIHVPMAGISLPIRAYSPTIMQQVVDCIESAPLGQEVSGQTVVIVNAPSHFYAMYLPVIRTLNGEASPKRVRSLGPNPESFAFDSVPMHITRQDGRTLVLRPEGGYEARPVLRDAAQPLRLGDTIHVAGMTVAITDVTSRGNPSEAAFTFDVPLEDPSLCWLQWKDNTLIPFTPPAVGIAADL